MKYHIDTGLIIQKFKENTECPLCEIQAIVEEQFLHEFLNDAVMEDSTREKVNKYGFCSQHFDKLFFRPNKLSVALQIQTRTDYLNKILTPIKSVKGAKLQAKQLEMASDSCIICKYTQESMEKYYKTIAQLFSREPEFIKLFMVSKGFCIEHYTSLLKYVSYAGSLKNDYAEALFKVQKRNFERIKQEVNLFCNKHDYRNANMPLGSAQTALPRMREKLYGKKEK